MALRTSLPVQPHLYIGDPTGRPLDYGSVYFGEPNKDPEFYPIDIFIDDALTVPISQPVRTKGGFLNANGDMIEVYALQQEYSIKVLDSHGYTVFYKPDMSSTNTDGSISVRLPYPDATIRNQSSKNSDYISVKDFESIQAIENAFTGKRIDMLGTTVTVATLPTNNQYYNGWFAVDGKEYRSDLAQDTQVSNENVIIGADTPILPLSSVRGLTVVGSGSMNKAGSSARSSTAIGKRALHNMVNGKYNIAIGLESQFHCNSNDSGKTKGTRNVSLGDNSLRFNVTGTGNVAMGRNAGQGLVNTINNVAIGTNAMSGFGSLKFKNLDDIYNTTPIISNESVAIGANALFYGGGNSCVAIGTLSLSNAKMSANRNIAVGHTALRNMGINEGINGGTKTEMVKTGAYVMTETDITMTVSGTGAKVGDYIYIRIQDGIPVYEGTAYRDPQIYKVKSVTGSVITVDEPQGVTASGTILVEALEDMAVIHPDSNLNIAIGTGAMFGATQGTNNLAIGADTLSVNKGIANVAVGDFALTGLTSASAVNNTAIGYGALRRDLTGALRTNGNNCIGIGYDSRASGDNQLQLGSSGTTTYSYGAVQDRSDARDKIVKGGITDKHIQFFNDVEFKRYLLDYRDSYIISNSDGTATELEKDGSRAGTREHVGVIAQQVEQAMQAHDVDFAGLQHHLHNGGNDVYTVGYQEFIPIMGEILQRQQKQIDELLTLVKDEAL